MPGLTHLDLSKNKIINDWFTKTPIQNSKNVNIGTVNENGTISTALGNEILNEVIRAVSGLSVVVTERLGMNQNVLEDF